MLPEFRYRAVAPDGIVENEVCPVCFAELPGDPEPAPDEVMEWRWVDPPDFLRVVDAMPSILSPWSVLQAQELRAARILEASVMTTERGAPLRPKRAPFDQRRGIIGL